MSATTSSDGDRNPHVRVVLRPVATPIAIGLGGLLIGTMMLNGLQLGWLSGADAATLLLLLLSAGRGRIVFGVVILCGCVRLTLTGLYEVLASDGLQTAAGIAGLVLAGACAYGMAALLMEDLPRKTLLPVGRSGRAASSLAGSFDEQLQAVENEAGVRRQL
jgi:hypothetical protein